MTSSPTQQDSESMQRAMKIVIGWTAVFIAVATALILYGDVLMELFT